MLDSCKVFVICHIREGRGEGRGILVFFFFKKSVGHTLRFSKKKTPDPPPPTFR